MKTNLPRLLHGLTLGLDERGHPLWAADRLTLREWGERVKRRNLAHAQIARMRGVLSTRVARRADDWADLDVIKAPGRRFGPTPLRLLLPQDGRAATPLDTDQRHVRYARQRVAQGRNLPLGASLTPRQRRRIQHKRNATLGGS